MTGLENVLNKLSIEDQFLVPFGAIQQEIANNLINRQNDLSGNNTPSRESRSSTSRSGLGSCLGNTSVSRGSSTSREESPLLDEHCNMEHEKEQEQEQTPKTHNQSPPLPSDDDEVDYSYSDSEHENYYYKDSDSDEEDIRVEINLRAEPVDYNNVVDDRDILLAKSKGLKVPEPIDQSKASPINSGYSAKLKGSIGFGGFWGPQAKSCDAL